MHLHLVIWKIILSKATYKWATKLQLSQEEDIENTTLRYFGIILVLHLNIYIYKAFWGHSCWCLCVYSQYGGGYRLELGLGKVSLFVYTVSTSLHLCILTNHLQFGNMNHTI